MNLKPIAVCAVLFAGCAEDGYGPEDFEVTDHDQQEDEAFSQALTDGKADGELTYVAVARLALNAGVSCSYERIAIAVAVARAESSFDPLARNTAGNAHGVDRGLWQINSYWHPEISNACAYSASCNARAMASISSKGTKWGQWWTYNNGIHLRYMTSARAAQRAVCQ